MSITPPAIDPADERPVDAARPFTKTAEDPTAFYASLRETCPVSWVSERTRYWALTRHEDIVQAAMQPEVFASGLAPRLHVRSVPLESDPPEHAQIRRVLQAYFLPARMATFEATSRAIVRELLEPLLAEGGGDLARGLTQPLTTQVLLTVINQPREDWVDIKHWAEDAYLDRSSDPADHALFKAADDNLYAYCRAMVADRRRAPGDPASDITSALLTLEIEGQDTDELAVGVLRLLVSAGHDSTTTALSTCLHHLAINPDDQAFLRADLSRIPTGVEEILRFNTPVISMPRVLTQDIDLHGREMKAGERVRLVFGSGNRDPRAFENAERCILDRKPNRHMVFGHGIHLCIGAPLARQEIRLALEELLGRTTSFQLAGEVVREFWHPYGMRCLPLWFDLA